MPSGILLGVATAISWGSSDFFARFASRTVGSVRAVLGMQAWGALFVTILLVFSRDWGHLFDGSGWRPWAWGILAGVITTFGVLALYRSFEIGKLALVGPVSASYPALTVILSFFSGERLTAFRIIGILAAMAGVLLVATGEKNSVHPDTAAKSTGAAGLAWAIAAALAFGILFWLLGTRIIPRTGVLAALWLIRITGAAIAFAIVVAQKIPLRIKNRRASAQVYTMGFFDTAGFAFSNLGMRIEQVAVVSVLGSLYGAVTVAFAAIFLKERVAFLQWLGIASIFVGVALMNA
ncbi:MAG TPA: DMT family transporter [Candidatus Acidoferrum sp.]|jgi:drug/metabolite transporter (DMT)-like permease